MTEKVDIFKSACARCNRTHGPLSCEYYCVQDGCGHVRGLHAPYCLYQCTICIGDPYGHFNVSYRLETCVCRYFVPWKRPKINGQIPFDFKAEDSRYFAVVIRVPDPHRALPPANAMAMQWGGKCP